MDKDSSAAAAAVKVRMPAILVPAYNAIMKTPDGSKAMKRIKVGCGICKSTKYYGITRGVTRVASVIACENCRHFYQKIRRDPVSLNCIADDKSSCYRSETFLDTKCKACWVMRLLDCCPHEASVYESISKLLSDECKKVLRGVPILPEELPEENTGSLALEILRNDVWVPVPSSENIDLENIDRQSGNGDSNSNELYDQGADVTQISKNLSVEEPSKDLNPSILCEDSSKGIKKLSQKDDLIGITNEAIQDIIRKQMSRSSSENMPKDLLENSSQEGAHNIANSSNEVSDKEAANKVLSKNVPIANANNVLQRSSPYNDKTEKSKVFGNIENLSENVCSQRISESKMQCSVTAVTTQDFDDVDMEEEEENVDDPAPVEVGIVTRKQKESNDEENGFGKKSERIKRKRKKVDYFSKPVERTGRRMKGLVHGPNGALLKNGKDLCDCLQEDCPGCHFPCPKCRSSKCGNECRVNRRWYYERVEVEGTKITFLNKFAPKM